MELQHCKFGTFLGTSKCWGHSVLQTPALVSLETTKPIEAKFHVEPPWDGGTKEYSNGPGHMTSMAAMPIYGKILKKIFFSGTERPIALKLGMQHQVLECHQVYFQMMTMGWPWLFLWQGQIWSLMLLYGKKVVVSDIKFGRCSQLNV